MSVNKAIIIGHLGKDPEVKDVSGTKIANFSVATSKSWKDEGGEKKEKTEWHNIVAFRKTAEFAGSWLKKGREVYIEGEIQTRSWDGEDGKKNYRTEIVAHNIQFVGPKTADTTAAPQESAYTPSDIPF